MHEQSDLLNTLLKFFIEFWGYLIAGIVAMFLWIGKRQVAKFDDVMNNYVHQEKHDKAITEIEERMLACQEGLRADQNRLFEEMRKHAENTVRSSNQLEALHKRMDKLMEMFVDYIGRQH